MIRWLVSCCMVAMFAVAHAQNDGSVSELTQAREAYFAGKLDVARAGLTPLAASGDPEAAYYLGLIERQQSKGEPKGLQRAVALWQAAATKGFALAMWEIGNAYANGTGLPEDVLLAVHWQRRAEQVEREERGDVEVIYLDDSGQPMNQSATAAAVERRADRALAGDAEAAYSLGRIYDLGVRVERDLATAIHWYDVAANLGHRHSAILLGYFACRGEGVSRSVSEANEWLAEAGRSAACTDAHEEEDMWQ